MREDIKERIDIVNSGSEPDGYVSDFGLTPITWKEYPLKAIAKKVNMKNRDNAVSTVLSNTAMHGIIRQTDYFDKDIANEDNMDGYYVVNEKDFVYNPRISSMAPYGPIHANDLGIKGIVSPLYTVFRLNNSDKYEYDFLRYYFDSSQWYKYMYTVANYGARHDRMNISGNDFFALPVALPPIKEQKKIVEILNQCDKVIELKQQLIEEERNRKKWLMQNLLNPDSGVKLPRFNSKWSKLTMGELFEFSSSLSASRADLSNEGTCYLHYGDIHGNNTGVIDVATDYTEIPKIDSYKSKVKMLSHGDVVFVDASEDYDGASKYVVVINPDKIPFVPGLHTIPARSRSDALDIDFKKYCFQSYSFRKQVAFYVSGMKVFGLNKENLAKIILAFPDIDEQQAIAKLLILSDKIISNMEYELTQWQQKKKALMQLLLTGIVRVSV